MSLLRKNRDIWCARSLCRACLVLLLGCLWLQAAQEASAPKVSLGDKRILVLTSYGYGRPGVEVLLRGFLGALNHAGISVEQVFTEHLDLERSRDAAFRQSLAETLRRKYSQRHLDLVYILEQPALDFFLEELAGITRDAPVVLVRAALPEPMKSTGHRYVRQLITYDIEGTLHRALEVFPDTRRILFVAGSTESDRAVLAQASRIMKQWKGEVVQEDTTALTLDQVKARIKDPAPGTVIVVLPFNRDAAGRTMVQMEMAFMVSASAGAPVFTLWENAVGQGAVGGSVTNFADVGQQAAEFSLELMKGRALTAPVTDLPARFSQKFDWLPLERWHGRPAGLPRESIFINRPVTLWEQYHRTVIVTALFLLAQTSLIALLLAQRRLRNLDQLNLRESEARFRVLVEQAPEAIVVFDPVAKRMVEANANAERLFGATRGQLQETGILRYYSQEQPDGRPPVETFFENGDLALTQDQLLFERAIRSADGRDLLCEVRVVRLPSTSHPLLRASFIDITDRKRAETALRESQERLQSAVAALSESEAEFRSLAESMPQIVWATRKDGWNIYFNHRWVEYTGLTLDESYGHGWNIPFHPDDRQSAWDAWQHATRTGGTYSIECRLRRADGDYRWWLIRGVPSFDQNGEIFKWFGTCTDIHDLKEAEENRKLLQAQLEQAQKMESLGNLAGGVAHDMNNVLGAILGMATASIQAHSAESPAYRAFDTIIQAATRGGKMVKGLLNFARQHPAEERELDVNEVLREEARLLEHTTLAKVRLEMDLAPALRPIRGDASALTHAFMNLCVNAVDAMPDNGVLTLRTRNVDTDWIEVRVEDTGIGMSRSVLARAMDPFFTTKEIGKGTGLGLSMVYRTVQAHQGQMEILSEPGQGTRVILRFPAIDPGSEARESTINLRLDPSRKALTFLVVDDDELIQDTLQELLEVMGHKATIVPSGEEALAVLESGLGPDIVILDMNMPGLGGAGTLPRLRALNPTVPVLLATGRVDQFASDLAAAHPYVTLLPKPYSMGELKRHLETLG